MTPICGATKTGDISVHAATHLSASGITGVESVLISSSAKYTLELADVGIGLLLRFMSRGGYESLVPSGEAPVLIVASAKQRSPGDVAGFVDIDMLRRTKTFAANRHRGVAAGTFEIG